MYTINDMVKFLIVILSDTGYEFSKEIPSDGHVVISIRVKDRTIRFEFNEEDGPDDFLESIDII